MGLKPHAFKIELLFIFVIFLYIQGCSLFSDKSTEDATPDMQVSVNFQEVHRCSRISPEITIQNAPKGTTSYDIRLIEANGNDEIMLGGGTWAEDGSGVIPEGAMTVHYRGPCPPAGQTRKYVYVVGAKKDQNLQPLAVRVAILDLE